MSHSRRVVITGMGVVTPLGIDIPTFWNNLVAGKSGIGRVTQIDTAQYACQIGGEVKDFEPAKYFKSPKDARRADR
ncbi:MAG: beta-ketoacyl-[acyl-carrier-protein] synthase II, partial [Verrucomicrobiaceae bacterium]